MEVPETLRDLGLSSPEAKVYIALLELGSSTTGPLIKKCGLYSSVVYYTLESLMKRGLVTYTISGKTKTFIAAQPEKLKELLNELELKVDDLIPNLASIQNSEKSKQEIFIYEGLKGAMTVFNDILDKMKEGDEQLVIGTSKNSMLSDFFKRWNKKREKLGVKKKIIINEDAKKYIPEHKKQRLIEVRTLPSEKPPPIAVNIFEEVMTITLWGNYPITIEIKNREITAGFKQYFVVLWRSANKVS